MAILNMVVLKKRDAAYSSVEGTSKEAITFIINSQYVNSAGGFLYVTTPEIAEFVAEAKVAGMGVQQ